VYSGVIFNVHQWPQTLFDGSTETFEMLSRPDTVVVIGVVDDKLVLIEDEQPTRAAHLTLPGGRVDPTDDSILATAKREMREEVGYSFANWKLVAVHQPVTKMEWFIHVYIADAVIGQGPAHLDAGEKITPKLRSYAEVRQLVMQRQGDLGDTYDLFEKCLSLADLLALSEFEGKLIAR